jgi:hypothetical protein
MVVDQKSSWRNNPALPNQSNLMLKSYERSQASSNGW